MDLLLTHGYFLASDPAEQRIMRPYPPLGLLYLSAFLKRRDFNVEVLDSTFISPAEAQERLRQRAAPVVGIYATLMTRQNALRLAREAKVSGAKVVLGGPEPVNYAEEYLAGGADVIVAGEGEETLAELLPALARGSDLGAIAGIVYRDTNGVVRRTLPRSQIRDLDSLPFPDRDALDLDRYLEIWQAHHKKRSVSLITARGCPYTCRWCSHSVYGFSHRRRSPANVVAELEEIRERYRPDQVWYADDVFTLNKRWLFEFASLMKQRGLKIPFETISREDRLDEPVIEALAELGCERLWIGAESGSQRILDAMDRRTDALRMRDMVRSLQRHGIRAGTFIMLGYDGENWDDITQTTDHLKDALPDDVLTTIAYPIKGTPYYDEVAHRIDALGDWESGSDRLLTVRGRYTRRFYRHAQRWIASEVAAAKLEKEGAPVLPYLKELAAAKGHRLAMYLTRHQTEKGST